METQVTQTNPPWGLDRIGQRSLPLNSTYSYTTTGAGVNVYVIDTGIRLTHTQFGGRAFLPRSMRSEGTPSTATGTGPTSRDHWRSTYGVAKSVRLFAVRVLSCSGSGSTSGVIAGVDWVTARRINPAVANMSLGGGVSLAPSTTRSRIRSPPASRIRSPPATRIPTRRTPLRPGSPKRSPWDRAPGPIPDRRSRISGPSLMSMRPVRPFSRRTCTERHRLGHAERHVDGGATRRGGCRQDSADLAGRFTGDGAEWNREHGDRRSA